MKKDSRKTPLLKKESGVFHESRFFRQYQAPANVLTLPPQAEQPTANYSPREETSRNACKSVGLIIAHKKAVSQGKPALFGERGCVSAWVPLHLDLVGRGFKAWCHRARAAPYHLRVHAGAALHFFSGFAGVRPWGSAPNPATFEKVDETFTCLTPNLSAGRLPSAPRKLRRL